MSRPKSLFSQRYVPTYAQHPLKLGWQLLVHQKPAARSALMMAAAGLLLAPLDKSLERKESGVYKKASMPAKPIIFICGPPRSGTTLVAQYLINALDVCYINNLSSLFPRSPVYVNSLLARWVAPRIGDYNSFYGKNRGLAGNNDGLYLWDRWLGSQRDLAPDQLVPGARENLLQYFGALQEVSGLPVVNKVNRLIAAAHLVAPVLPMARFIFIHRNPVMLAQSLLLARKQLTGDLESPYGLHENTPSSGDPIEDVCQQVEFHHDLIEQQMQQIDEERFILLDYADFCASPTELLDEMRSRWQLDISFRETTRLEDSFSESVSVKIPQRDFERLQKRLGHVHMRAAPNDSGNH